ncbi:MAG TPA: hopanoid C-3 methylase HpnR [Candidatus Binataceae bacterium]|nr:hopanoid C-3 methylase HpnR [Candidatus Binataceae bacterium]
MRVLLVHPGPLMYSELYLRLEPLGLERVAAAVRAAGHEVQILDLQIFNHADFYQTLASFDPSAVGFSLNYLANVPEVIELAEGVRRLLKQCAVFVGGHSASFIADELLEHSAAIDCVLRGEGEGATPLLLEGIAGGGSLAKVPGAITRDGPGPPPKLLENLDRHFPARDLTRRRDKYFIGVLDPCASIEFSRGCPWDCSFCSAWTFYGRSYRKSSPEAIAEDMRSINEPNAFIVDDVAFVHAEDGFAIGHEIEKRKLRKSYYLETRTDVLCRNFEVFEYWRRLGLRYMFLGLEAIEESELKAHRKRSSSNTNLKALELARKLGVIVAVNLIADPSWDEQRFAAVRDWALAIPEVVHLTVATPYPGTEIWFTESRKLTTLDYRLFDIQHAVLPTRLPLQRFYQELVKTQEVLNRKFLGWGGLKKVAPIAARLALQRRTNFLRMLWKFKDICNPGRQYADHFREVRYTMRPPSLHSEARPGPDDLYVHNPRPSGADKIADAEPL